MAILKPYTCRTQCPFFSISVSDHSLPFPISKTNLNSPLSNPIFLCLSQPHSSPPHQPIVCARRRRGRGLSLPSNRKILQLASTIAFNLKILPEPFNSLAGEIVHRNWNREFPTLSHLVGGLRGKISSGKKKKRKLEWFVFVLICVAGLWSWRVSELDMFVKALLFCLFGMSLVRLWKQKGAIKEWFLGFLFGIVLILSFSPKLGKDDVKFWIRKLRTCSPVAGIAVRIRNGRLSK